MSNFYSIVGKKLAKDDKDGVWGWHLIVDCRGCDKSTVESESTIKSYLNIIVDKLDMIPVGDEICYNFDDGNGRGVSGLRLITTSHVSCHTDADEMCAYLDIFSCNEYTEQLKNTALACIKEYFNPKKMYHIIILRRPDKITDEDGNERSEDNVRRR